MTPHASRSLPTPATHPGLTRAEVKEVIATLSPHLDPGTSFAAGPSEFGAGLVVQVIEPEGRVVLGGILRIDGIIAVMDFMDQLDLNGASGPYETIPEAVAAMRLAWGSTQPTTCN